MSAGIAVFADNEDEELKDLITYLIIAVSVLICVILVLAAGCCWLIYKKQKRNKARAQKLKSGIEFNGAFVPSATNVSNYDSDKPPSPIIAQHTYSIDSVPINGKCKTSHSEPQPAMTRVPTKEGEMVLAIEPELHIQTQSGMYNTNIPQPTPYDDNTPSDGNQNHANNIDDLLNDDEESSKDMEMYQNDSDKLMKRQPTVTAGERDSCDDAETGDDDADDAEEMYRSNDTGNVTPGYGPTAPQQAAAILGMNKQMSLTTPQMIAVSSMSVRSGNNSAPATPNRLSPSPQLSRNNSSNYVPNLDLNNFHAQSSAEGPMSSYENDLSSRVPLPSEDDYDVVQDMPNVVTKGGPEPNTENLDDGEDDVEYGPADSDGDEDEDCEEIYDKAKAMKTPETPIPNDYDFANDGSSEEDNHEAMYDLDNKTKGNKE